VSLINLRPHARNCARDGCLSRLSLVTSKSAFDTRFHHSQFLTVIREGCTGGRQQQFQVPLSDRVTLDLDNDPIGFVAISHGRAGRPSAPQVDVGVWRSIASGHLIGDTRLRTRRLYGVIRGGL
jgi:hypothetical protein